MFSTARLLALVLGSTAILLLTLFHAAPAGAVIVGNVGVQPRATLNFKSLEAAGPLQYHGGSVLHSSDAYVIYWDPVGDYRGDWERLIDEYFQNVGAESGNLGDVFALDGQYGDSSGRASNKTTFRGSYKDEDPYPLSGNCTEPAEYACLTDSQIQAELQHMITSVDPPLPGVSGTPVYYLLTPPGVTVCTDSGSTGTCSNSTALEKEEKYSTGICGYHSAIGLGGASPIPYVVQPWIAGDAGEIIESFEPLVTSGYNKGVTNCQDGRSLEEPNQLDGLNPFGNYAEGLADVIISDLNVEQQNVVVDPFLNGWYQTATEAEQGDLCQFNFGPPPSTLPAPNSETHAGSLSNETINGTRYYVPWAFNSTGVTSGKGFACWSGVALEPDFTAPNPVFSGDIVGFNATESDLTLDAKTTGLPGDEPFIAPVYTWEFGDGTTVSGANDSSVFHSYQYGGTYTVKLTVVDSGGNTNNTIRLITVVGPPPPASSSSSPAGSSGSAGAAATQGGSSSSPGASPTVVPPPVAAAAILPQKLRNALHKGLVVSYSVNEQVAGHFEVLLGRTAARQLGISGTPAAGLPAGSPAELVIAKAILVTTKGGHSAVHIQFSKKTAGRLEHAHKVSLMLRLIVRNASSSSPATTTVVSNVTLGH
jgi:PKD domain